MEHNKAKSLESDMYVILIWPTSIMRSIIAMHWLIIPTYETLFK